MSAKKVSLKLPDSLVQIINSHAKTAGKDRNTVIVQALQQVFEVTPEQLPSATAETFSQQQNSLAELKTRLEQLEKTVATLTQQIAELNQPIQLDEVTLQEVVKKILNENPSSAMRQPPQGYAQPPVLQQINESPPQSIDVLPSHYVQIDNFLTLDETRRLLDYVAQQQAAFVPTNTSNDALDYRRSMALYFFPEFSELIINRLQEVMPTVLNKLNIPSFSISQIETQLTAHNHAHYYKIHNDNGSPETATREFSYVYYFYQEPKAFSGGELLIYDSKIENHFYVAAESYQTVEPRHNSIVFFLSRYMHEVLPVICSSQAFADSRFTINGWIRRDR